jgi:hypothetical protein
MKDEIMSNTPNQDKLKQIDQDLDIIHRHVSWALAGQEMSAEEKAAYLVKMYEAIAKDVADVVTIPVSQLINIADALRSIVALGKIDVREMFSSKVPKEVHDLKHKIFMLAEFPAIFAEQNLPKKLQIERREARLKKMKE